MIMFWRSLEQEFVNGEIQQDDERYLVMLSKVFREVKDKIQVVAADVRTEIGRRYAILMGVNPNDSILKAKFRILKADKHKSQSSKFALNIPQERVTQRDIVEFVGKYLRGDL